MVPTLITLGIIVVGLAALLGYAASKPDAFRIQRSSTMKAPPEKIFPLVNDLHSWVSWSPWEKIDPALKRTYSGTASGAGAAYEWEGNKKVGQGRMEISESVPNSKLTMQLHFIKPFQAHNVAEFTFEGHGESTNVTWAMHGRQPFMIKVMCLFFSMDKMVGKEFEAGLANLRSIVEG